MTGRGRTRAFAQLKAVGPRGRDPAAIAQPAEVAPEPVAKAPEIEIPSAAVVPMLPPAGVASPSLLAAPLPRRTRLPLRPRDYSDLDWIEHLEAALSDMRRQLDEAVAADIAPQLQRSLGLTAHEARLLAYLWRRSPMLASKSAILAALADPDDIDGGPDPKIVDVFISKLRSKLETLRGCIETVWGQGYLLNSEGRRRLSAILGLPT